MSFIGQLWTDILGYLSSRGAVNVNPDKLPLIPSDYPSLDEAFQTFVTGFESRYGNHHPPFLMKPLQAAVTQAFECPGSGQNVSERRPLAMYIHSDYSVAANVFPTQILCSDVVSSLLQKRFCTWAWDVSYSTNKRKLEEWLRMLKMDKVIYRTRYLSIHDYPLLLVVVKDRGTYKVAQLITGQDSVDVAITKLIGGFETYASIQNLALQQEKSRNEREKIRAEQVAAYEESKATDKAKKEKSAKIAREKMEAEEARLREEQEIKEKMERLKPLVPPEPPTDAKDVIMIRLRLPDGNHHIRR
uniref:UBX domain-containing protein n=1 Tax=Panagrolaimus sp. JU765 TaxID=591449 RepID=A0AC34QDL4_9BILA